MKRFMMLMMFAMLGSVVNAQMTTNPLWMVSSKAAMVSYAKSQVRGGYVGFSSGASVNEMSSTNYAYANLPVGNCDLFAVVDCLKTQTVSFAVARPDTDYVSFFEDIYDQNGYGLFLGSSYGQSEMVNGLWTVPSSMLSLDLQLSSCIPISIANLVSAKLILRDDNGNVVQDQGQDVYNWGQGSFVYFSTYLIGCNGDFAVTVDNGGGKYTTIVSSLRDNKKYTISEESTKVGASVHGIIRLPDDATSFTTNLPSYNGRGESPLICGKFTHAEVFVLHVDTLNPAKDVFPRGVWYQKNGVVDQTVWQYQSTLVPGPILINITDPGNYDFILDWEDFDNQTFEPSVYWGGKG